MADPAKQKGSAAPYDSPPPPYTPMMCGPVYMPQAPPSVIHPNVRISPNVRIHDPSRVKINGMPLTTAYPPQVVGMTTFGPGYQQTTGFVAGNGFQSMQSMQQSSGPGQMQQSVFMPGTGIVMSQNFGGGPPGPYQY